ncbi:MAG: hypothetical protein RLZZ215_407 [Pseudomonadota bacterium]|jgi:hypothetical protein
MTDKPRESSSLARMGALVEYWADKTRLIENLAQRTQSVERLLIPLEQWQTRLKPLHLSRIKPSGYQKVSYQANAQIIQPEYLTPQLTGSPSLPQPRPSIGDKQQERREIYEQVVRDLGRYAQKGLLVAEAAKRAHCSEKTMRAAIKGKK